MARIILELTGTSALVYHNIRMADKDDPIVKEIEELTHKKDKTDEDRRTIEHLEFLGSLYFEKAIGVYLPTWNIVRSIETGARLTKEGANVIRTLVVLSDKVPLTYEGPREPEALWKLPEFRFRTTVGVQRNKVSRMRPIFHHWSLTLEAEFVTDMMNPDDLLRVAKMGGLTAGLGDARKLGYGRYSVEMA